MTTVDGQTDALRIDLLRSVTFELVCQPSRCTGSERERSGMHFSTIAHAHAHAAVAVSGGGQHK